MALDRYQKLPPLSEALSGSQFEENLDCIQKIFDKLKITTVDDLDNSPRILTCSFCMCSTHKLIEHIRAYMENGNGQNELLVEEEPAAQEVQEEPEVEEVVEEEPEEEPEEKKTSSTRRSSSRSKKKE